MRELTADMFVSLDGFTAGSDGSQGAFRGQGGPEFGRYIQSVLDEPQVLILGRATYELLSGSWGQSSEASADRLNSVSKVVFSKTLAGPLEWNARLANGDLAEEIAALKREPGDPLRSIGSVTLVRGLMQLGLVDRVRLAVFPLVLGATGTKPMFGGHSETVLQLVDTAVFDGNVLVLEYRPATS
jgi:dihydrofolate reductase